MQQDIFAGSKLLISGAREDIYKIDRQIETFFQSEPYAHIVEHDAKAGVDIYKMKMTKQLPVYLNRDISRVANELRSALDQAGFACAQAAGNTRLKYTYFPFGSSATHLDDVIRGRCKDLPTEIKTLFRGFNAYKGGDNLLCATNEIANGLKHRAIIPVGQGVGAAIVHNLHADNLVELCLPPIWDTSKDEIVLLKVRHGSNADYDVNLGFIVAFGKIDSIKGHSVTPTLTAMANKIEGILVAIENEAINLGLMI